jgi:hypothetical protein
MREGLITGLEVRGSEIVLSEAVFSGPVNCRCSGEQL